MEKSFNELVQIRNQYALEEKKLYLNYATKLNSLSDEALRTDFVAQFVDGCVSDIVGQLVRTFIPLTDTYVTADQLFRRVKTFTYDTDYDPLFENHGVRLLAYGYDEVQGIREFVNSFNKKMEKLDRGIYVDGKLTDLREYREKEIVDKNTGMVVSELTKKTLPNKLPKYNVAAPAQTSLEGDHKIPISEAVVNVKFIKDRAGYREEAERIYNDPQNIWYIDALANYIKLDIGNPNEIINAWISAKPEWKEILRQRGVLDEAYQVPEDVKNRLTTVIADARKFIDKNTDLNTLDKIDAAEIIKEAADSLIKPLGSEKTDSENNDDVQFTEKVRAVDTSPVLKIFAGQILYYLLPPIVWETRCIIASTKKANISPDLLLEKLQKAYSRIAAYTFSHTRDILGNTAHNTVKHFIRTVFDMVIALLKSYIRHFVQIAKTVTMSVLDSIRIIVQPGTDKMQKADAVTNLFVLGLTNTLLDIAFEYLELQGIPAEITEVVQVLASVVVSNLVFILMEKLDLFDVRYGFKIAKLEQIFANASTEYTADRLALQSRTQEEIDLLKNDLLQQIESFKKDLATKNFYAEDVFEDVERINQLFNMDISFIQEWDTYIQAPAG